MYCPNCGAKNLSGGKFCIECGTSLEAEKLVGESKYSTKKKTPQSNSALGSAVESTTPTLYAKFRRRVAAYLIDFVIAIVAMSLIGFFWGMTDPTVANEDDFSLNIAAFLLTFIYMAGMESSGYQATLGKLAVGIKVTDLKGQRISFARAVGRYFAHIASGLTFGFGYVMAAFTQRRQALHDKMAGTLVVDKSATAGAVAAAGPAIPVSGWVIAGVSLVVLTVPLGGALAAIAIPAYMDYTTRAQVADGLSMAAAYKAAVAEAWSESPLDIDKIDFTTVEQGLNGSGKYVESISIHTGAIVITFGNDASSEIQGLTLTLVPAFNDKGELGWACGGGEAPSGFEVIFDDHGQYTDTPDKYLPSICRMQN